MVCVQEVSVQIVGVFARPHLARPTGGQIPSDQCVGQRPVGRIDNQWLKESKRSTKTKG